MGHQRNGNDIKDYNGKKRQQEPGNIDNERIGLGNLARDRVGTHRNWLGINIRKDSFRILHALQSVAYLAIAPDNDRLDASKYLSCGKPVVQPVKPEIFGLRRM
jgi:hypothetical protein